jgi:hypothetical protein
MLCAVAEPSTKPELKIAKNIIRIICLFSFDLIGVHNDDAPARTKRRRNLNPDSDKGRAPH